MNLEVRNDTVRERLKEHIDRYGIMQKFVANKVSVSKASMSMFLADKRNLTSDILNKIEEFLNT